MSTMLSMISRQLDPGMSMTSHVMSLHSPLSISTSSGIICSSIGGLSSGSCQTKSWWLRSIACQVRVCARSGTRFA